MDESNEKYDVVVVGAGPAGSTAAYMLSHSGFKVLIVDKSRFPREKLCGGLLTQKTIVTLERIFGETISSLSASNVLESQSSDYEVFYKHEHVVSDSADTPFHFVDRLKYDAYLLEKARSAGAHVIEGERVELIDPSEAIIKTHEARQVKAKILVGADGVNSTVRMSFPGERFERTDWQRNLATAFETFIPRSEVPAPPDHPIIVLGFVNWGYSWIFPNRERLAVGLGGLNRENGRRFLQSFDDFLAARALAGQRKRRLAANLIPYGNYLRSPAFMRTVLVGDAAGFVDPMLGEGIYYAHRSAELAVSAVREYLLHRKELSASYLRLLRKHIYPDLDRAKRIRWLVFTSLDMLHRHALRPLLNRSVRKRLIRLVHGTEAQLSDAIEAIDDERT